MIKGTVKDHFSKSMDSLFTNIKREGLPIDHEDMKSLIQEKLVGEGIDKHWLFLKNRDCGGLIYMKEDVLDYFFKLEVRFHILDSCENE